MIILLLLSLFAFALWLRMRGTRFPDVVRDGFSAGVRELKIASGSYRLDDVVDRVVRQALASAIPSVSCTYMPTHIEVGLAKQDATTWSALFPAIAEELAELIAAAAVQAGFRVNGDVMVTVRVDAAAEPGKPHVTSVLPPLRSTSAELTRSARTHQVVDLDKTQAMPSRLRQTGI